MGQNPAKTFTNGHIEAFFRNPALIRLRQDPNRLLSPTSRLKLYRLTLELTESPAAKAWHQAKADLEAEYQKQLREYKDKKLVEAPTAPTFDDPAIKELLPQDTGIPLEKIPVPVAECDLAPDEMALCSWIIEWGE